MALIEETPPRYLLHQEKDHSWSIADREIIEIEPDHRMVSGLNEARAIDLVRQLNAASTGGAEWARPQARRESLPHP